MVNHWRRLALSTVFNAFLFASAQAGTPLTIQTDQSQPMLLASDPASIIIGNPSIADVSLNGRQLILHGHAFGETNLIVMDADGKRIVDFDITVSHDTANQLSLYFANANSSAQRHSYTCAPNCEASMMTGDPDDWMAKVIASNRAKSDFATGVKTSDLVTKGSSVALSPSQ